MSIIPDWAATTAAMAHEQGYRVTPVFKGGSAKKYASGETYVDPVDYRDAVAVGVVLDGAVLLDYDGNKADEAGEPIVGLDELAAMLGLDEMPQAVQEGSNGRSLHFLFQLPPAFKGKASSDGWRPYIDLKTGNQLMHLKPHKVLNDEELPRREELPTCPQALLDALAANGFDGAPRDPWDGSRKQLREAEAVLKYIYPDLPYDEWVKVLMGIHERFGNSAEGIELADEWSKHGSNYSGRKLIRYKFSTFENTGGITFASLCKRAQDAGADLATIGDRSFDELIAAVAELNEGDDVLEVLDDAIHLDPVQLDRLLKSIKRQTGDNIGGLREYVQSLKKQDSGEGVDQLDMARAVIDAIGAANLIADESGVYRWRDSGVWRAATTRAIKRSIHAVIPGMADSVSSNLVSGVSDLLTTEVFVEGHQFNVGANDVVNCPNGQVTLVDAEWQLKQHAKEDYRTTQIPVPWDDNAQCPRFEEFLLSVFEGTLDRDERVRCVLECIGYSLMSHCRYEVMIMLVGNGANGKSVLLSVIEQLLGRENISGVQPSQLDRTFQRAHLHQKLANIVTEIAEGEVMADNAVKAIVTGETCTVERKHQHPFDMRPFATLWMGTNHMPHSRDFSDGFFRRAVVLDFPNQFKPDLGNCDPYLRDKLMTELSGILRLSLDFYAQAVERGKIHIPPSVLEQRGEWRRDSDHVQVFVEDECETGIDKTAAIGDIFRRYDSWASAAGIRMKVTRANLGKRLNALGYKQRRTSAARFYDGIQPRRNF